MNAGFAGRVAADFREGWKPALAFHVLVQLLATAILAPVATWLAHRLVMASGEPVVSNFDIARFVLSPAGVVFVLLVAALVIGLLLAEFAGHSWIAAQASARRHTSAAATTLVVLRLLPRLLALATRIFLRLLLLAMPFVAVLVLAWFTTLADHDINYYLKEQPPEWRRALLLAAVAGAAYALLAAWQLARWLFAVPALLFEGLSARTALARSMGTTRGRLPVIVLPLVAWWLLLTAVTVLVTWLCRYLSDAGLDWAGIDVRRVLPLVALYLSVTLVGTFLYGALWFAGHQFLVTRMYGELVSDRALQPHGATGALAGRPSGLARIVPAALAVLLVAAGVVTWVIAQRIDLDDHVAITAHRGASVAAPENTMAAFRAAIEAGADFIELDVQRTRDGRIVVLHDGDLMRVAGDPRKVRDLTLAELQAIDVGRSREARFAGEVPPALEEVIELARGRIRLNVELKYNVADAGLAPAVVDLLRGEDFLDQVVITSLDYAALKQVRQIEPAVQTGHIVTAAVGNVVRTGADFLSLNSARATPSLVRKAHSSGKHVHVWTVNDPEVMMRMIERGVDNVITDDPELLVRVLDARRNLDRAELLGLRLRVLFDIPPRELTDPTAVEVL